MARTLPALTPEVTTRLLQALQTEETHGVDCIYRE
jgi:hypothetical protein